MIWKISTSTSKQNYDKNTLVTGNSGSIFNNIDMANKLYINYFFG